MCGRLLFVRLQRVQFRRPLSGQTQEDTAHRSRLMRASRIESARCFVSGASRTAMEATDLHWPHDEYFGYSHGPLPYRSLSFRYETASNAAVQEVAQINYPTISRIRAGIEYKHTSPDSKARSAPLRTSTPKRKANRSIRSESGESRQIQSVPPHCRRAGRLPLGRWRRINTSTWIRCVRGIGHDRS